LGIRRVENSVKPAGPRGFVPLIDRKGDQGQSGNAVHFFGIDKIKDRDKETKRTALRGSFAFWAEKQQKDWETD
jgi:hypothetical protein